MKKAKKTGLPVAAVPDYDDRILTLIRGNLAPLLLREQLTNFHEKDIAQALPGLSPDERSRLYSVLDEDTLADVLAYADPQYMAQLPIHKRLEVLSRLEPAKAAEYLQTLEKGERQVLLELLDGEVRQDILLLASFEGEEIGREMSTNYVVIRYGSTVRQAMAELVEQAAENDNIGTVYVVYEDETFAGAIDLKDLIVARENTPLERIMMTSYPYVYAREQTQDCVERLAAYAEDSIPVLDGDNRLCGVLTAQDLTRLVDASMGDDYAKLGGLSAEEDLHEPLFKSIRKRLPWLIVLLGLGLLVSAVMGLFEKVVSGLALIVCFQSLILDMAGNVGTQSLAVTIRVLTDEKLSGRQKWALVGKEAKVGLSGGLLLGTLSVVIVGLYVMVLKGQPASLAFAVALCTGTALVVSMLLSSVTGTVVPLIFKKWGVDPAVASGPLITTLNDMVAVVTYYGLAWLMLMQMSIL